MPLAAVLALQFGQPTGHTLTPLHFGVNVEFFRAYLAAGVADQEEAFANALRASGIRALRFPGGNPAYYYLPDSREQSRALAHAAGFWEFREDNPPSNCFVTVEQLAAFARKHQLVLIYELPCLFHLDGEQPRATIRSKFSDRAGNYDHARLEAGVAYGMSIVRRLRELKAPVALWELGNEEFAHCEPADYAAVAAAYLRALEREDPETPVTVVAMGKGWLDAVAPLLKQAGVLSRVGSFQAHYPFGNWPGPGKEGDRGNAALFAMSDLKIEKWLAAHWRTQERFSLLRTPLSVTETMVMRHKNWDPSAIIGTQGHALCYAWNWMALLTDSRVDCAVFHDCAAPYFGMLRYDVGFDPQSRHFHWLTSPSRPAALSPKFPGQYVLSPTGLANSMLAELCGEELVEVRNPVTAGFRALASRNRVVLVNRGENGQPVRLPFKVGSAETLTADTLSSCLPDTFRRQPLPFSADPENEGSALATLPPRSVSVLRRRR